ncbi:hypothetical protein [Oceanobacillus sp. FSL H7-0719]|uniref:hypothetical protein n=1 Tax=Oceanobacillus sp. FSL H7-0719 TaxID=2954507 RepID=UPI003255AC9B
MKKVLFTLMILLFLTACGGADKEYKDQLKESEKRLEESQKELESAQQISEQIDETTESLEDLASEMGIENDDEDGHDIDELRSDLEYEVLGDGDVLTDLIIENGEVKATIEIGDNDTIEGETLLAESLYSSAGDVMFLYEGWEVFTVEFVGLGEISLHREDGEINDYDMGYFPLEKIVGQLD